MSGAGGAPRRWLNSWTGTTRPPGFTAMQRLTGWHAAICLGLAVRGRLGAGVIPVERVPGDLVVAEGRARGWDIRERVT